MNGNTDNIPAQESAREYYTHQQLRLSEESDMDLQRDTHDGLIMPGWAPQAACNLTTECGLWIPASADELTILLHGLGIAS